MKRLAILAPLALLAACGDRDRDEAAAPATAASDTIPMDGSTAAAPAVTTANGTAPGTYDITTPEGTQMVSELRADGTYEDRNPAGKVTEKGTWAVKESKTCFDPEGDAAEVCFTEGARNPDGSFDATGADGEVTKVKPRTA